MPAKVVIGMAFGDEGKGQTVHALARPDSIVVRFNGGCQAGHTVTANGCRRVFSHVGSGTLQGAETYLSRYFVCSPLAFLSEAYDLACNGIYPKISVSPDCPVTTIYDIAINRLLEESRGASRHGSVGVGFGETLERHGRFPFTATVWDLLHGDVEGWLRGVRDEWVPLRCAELGLDPARIPEATMSSENIEGFVHDCEEFIQRVTVVQDDFLLSNRDRLVFEGAQGLLLDQDYGRLPHVTRSNTGLKNVQKLMDGSPLEVYYVTRAYTTRHGAGPLPQELPAKPYPKIHDPTNIYGPYQGRLRFSYLNLDLIGRAVREDARLLPSGSSAYSVVTCLDQLPERAFVIEDNSVCPRFSSHLDQAVEQTTGCRGIVL